MPNLRRFLPAAGALFAAACSDANPVAPVTRPIVPATRPSAALVEKFDSLGFVSTSVNGPNTAAADNTASYTVSLSAPAVDLAAPIDVVFVMDASGSVGSAAWQQEKDAVVAQINNGLPLTAHIGIVEFSTNSVVKYTFLQNQTRSAITSVVSNLTYLQGYTATLDAMKSAVSIFETGMRPGSRHVVVLLTDGTPNPSTQNPCGTTAAANTLRSDLDDLDVTTFILGVGSEIRSTTLGCLIDYDPLRFVAVSDFGALGAALDDQIRAINTVKSVTYTATIPAGFSVVGSPAAPSGTTAGVANGVLTWTVPTLSGNSYSLNFTLKAGDDACGTSTALTGQSVNYVGFGQSGVITFPDAALALHACDTTPPVVAPAITGTAGNAGWYVGDVSVHWNVNDPESGIASSSGCADATVAADTPGTTFTCSAENGVGLSATQSVGIKRDATKPVIGFSGNAGSYTIDQTVAITCSATDALSGIASTTCADVAGPAYTFTIGTNTRSATATDVAGNSASASTTFTVNVTTDGLAALVTRMVNGSYQKKLLDRIRNIADKLGKNSPALDEQVKQFLRDVSQAQQAGQISATDAAVLSSLVTRLQ